MSKTSIQATKITQPLAGKRIQNSKGKNIKSPSVCRDGDAAPSYHPWEIGTLNNFIKGKGIQCGRKSTYLCNLKTVRWIKGYRNTCPLAGCCGTFNRPAPLILSKFNFSQKNITKKIKISDVKISYKHHATGVNVGVGSGSEKKNWTGYFPYVDIILYKNSDKIQTIRHNKAVPLAKDSTVSVAFTKDITPFDPSKDDLRIEINYSANGAGKYYTKATNPAIIYAKDLKVDMTYEFLEEPKIQSISVTSSKSTLITDPRNPKNPAGNQNCRDTIVHTLEYENTTASDVIVTVPKGVIYSKKKQTSGEKKQIVYTYQDTSGVIGTKSITYTLDSNKKKQITRKYTAKAYTKPTVQIHTEYIKDQTYSNQNFVSVSGTCWSNITIYVDGDKKKLIEWENNNINQADFSREINKLSCGYHDLNVHIDNIFYKTFRIYIKAPQIIFESDLKGEYIQDKTQEITINIKRVDNSLLEMFDTEQEQFVEKPIYVTIIDTANKEVAPQEIPFYPETSYEHTINMQEAGIFELKYSYNNGCGDVDKTFGEYVITPPHSQSYDNLLIRGKDTDIKYESIVIRRGDNQKKPVTYVNVEMRDSMSDFVLFGKDGRCALGELGYGILAIKNISAHTIHNLCIELNPLIESDTDDGEEYNPLVMEWQTGMLQNFVKNFKILNPAFKDIVEIYNIQNKDLINEGTENVVLCIKEIKSSSEETNIIELKIPFSYSYEKEIYMNFLVLGEPNDFVDLDDRTNGIYSNEEFYYKDNYGDINLFASHTSKQETRGCMCISLKTIDLLSTELSITGDDLDRNDIENPDDLDIKYTINISEEDCDENGADIFVDTEIVNDARLIPTGYQIGDGEKQNIDLGDGFIQETMSDNNGNFMGTISFNRGLTQVENGLPGQNVFLRYLDRNNQVQFIRATTNKNGIAKFEYTIPDYYQDNDDEDSGPTVDTKEKYYLTDILKTIDIFYEGDSFRKSALLGNEERYQSIQTEIDIWGVVYQQDNQDIFVRKDDYSAISRLNVNEFSIVGQLREKDSQRGINNQIVKYNYPYITISDNEDKISQSNTTATNKTLLYGEDKIGLEGFFKIQFQQYQFSHTKSFAQYENLTNEEILSNYEDIDETTYHKEISGICSYVVDGDTLDINVIEENEPKTIRVRLVGINTPEKGIMGYDVSKRFVEKLCLNQQISIDVDEEMEKDKYGRTLAVVIVDNKNLNQILYEEGLAEIMYITPSEFDAYGETISHLYDVQQMLNNGYIAYNGDLTYAKTNSNANATLFDDTNKQDSHLSLIRDYSLYRRGETVSIMVQLTGQDEKFINTIDIHHQIKQCCQRIHIFYTTCSEHNTEGFKTIFKTTSDNVIPNQIEKLIYCGVETDLRVLARLQKRIIEKHNVNVLTINAINGYKPNKNVLIKALIGPNPDKKRLGDYLALSAVDIDKEKYSYDQSSDIIYWQIGDMNSYETQICNILLEGEEIGDNTIYVCGFDYLQEDIAKTVTTQLTLEKANEKDKYYVGDTVEYHAFLKQIDDNDQPVKDVFGQIYFDIENEDIPNTRHKTQAQAEILTFEGQHYAIGHARLISESPTSITAKYDGGKMISTTYEPSTSNTLIYDNVYKYDTVVELHSDQEQFVVNQNIQIAASVFYNNGQDKYFSQDLNIKFIVENQEINNVLYSDNDYIINFAVTVPGEYMIRVFIPETNKTQESSNMMRINVSGENNEQ